MTIGALCSPPTPWCCILRRMLFQGRKRRNELLIIGLVASWVLAALQTCAQQSAVSSYSAQQLRDMATQMREEAKRSGSLNDDALERHLDSATILAVRTKNGRAEFHSSSADEFFVVHGHATLVTGGTIVNPQGIEEIRGDSVQGGTRAILKEGDVVHIPSKTPHQLLLNGGMFIYVLVKLPSR